VGLHRRAALEPRAASLPLTPLGSASRSAIASGRASGARSHPPNSGGHRSPWSWALVRGPTGSTPREASLRRCGAAALRRCGAAALRNSVSFSRYAWSSRGPFGRVDAMRRPRRRQQLRYLLAGANQMADLLVDRARGLGGFRDAHCEALCLAADQRAESDRCHRRSGLRHRERDAEGRGGRQAAYGWGRTGAVDLRRRATVSRQLDRRKGHMLLPKTRHHSRRSSHDRTDGTKEPLAFDHRRLGKAPGNTGTTSGRTLLCWQD
jgi:hypothetical protein